MKELPSRDVLVRALDYNHFTGVFTWRYREDASLRWNNRHAGTVAGGDSGRGYIGIRVGGKPLLANRLAWVYVYGFLDNSCIVDHKDCNPSNNGIENLRLANKIGNMANSRKRKNKLLPKGVTKDKSIVGDKPYRAKIYYDGKLHHLGRFSTAEEAHETYKKKAREVFGEFARAG